MEEDKLEVGGRYHQGERYHSHQQHQKNGKQSIQFYICGKDGHTNNQRW